jgi:hypothetical protein
MNPAKKEKKAAKPSSASTIPKYPRHSVQKALRIPRAILEQNAGQDCKDSEAAVFTGVGFAGPFKVELSSGIKYGLLSRPESGRVIITDLAKKILHPQKTNDLIDGLREAALNSPEISKIYTHYRGENLPDK